MSKITLNEPTKLMLNVSCDDERMIISTIFNEVEYTKIYTLQNDVLLEKLFFT